MSDRLKQLRDLIEAAPGKPAEYARWHALLEAEIAERDAPPPVLEGALAEVVQQLNLATGLVRMLRPDARERFRGVVEAVEAARTRLEALALRGARPATRAEWLAVALDLAQDEGEVTEELERALGKVFGRWELGLNGWERRSLDGSIAFVPDGDGPWQILDSNGDTLADGEAPTLREAKRAADAALRAEGRILLEGLPPEVALEGAAATATVDDDGRLVPADDEEPEVERRPEVGEEEPADPLWDERVTREMFGPALPEGWNCGRPHCNDFPCPANCRGRPGNTPPEEAQPDASWLRLEGRFHADMWTYRGDAPQQDADITGADAFDVLIAWLNRRGLLVDWRAYTLPGRRLGYVEIRTRAPLVGARGDA